MNYKKINKFLILYIIYVIFVFAKWQMTHDYFASRDPGLSFAQTH